ncbi:MAG: NAD(P)H:quinone oxidoreductase [Qingshengfaniella sp.]
MATAKIAIVFYSTYGTNHQVALAAAEAAKAAGAEVRVRRIAETVPEAVVNGQEPWKAQLEKMQDIPVVTPEDLEWSNGYFFIAPTRFGAIPSQMRAFIDTLGPLWQTGGLANKVATAATSAQNTHAGQEATILSLYTTFMHWGAIVVAPGFTDPSVYETGGNPYGYSVKAGEFDDKGKASVSAQTKRLVEMAAKLSA